MLNLSSKKASVARSVKIKEKPQTIEYLVYFLFQIMEILLIFRFVFKLTGASSTSRFVSTIYSLTHFLVVPFEAIFPQTHSDLETATLFEPAALIAMVVYAVLAWGIIQILFIPTNTGYSNGFSYGNIK